MSPIALVFTKLTFFADTTCNLPHQVFFFIPPWWEYLNGTVDPLGKCVPNFQPPNDIFPVALAILDMLLRLGGFAAVVGLIMSGVEYIIATGSPDKISNARRHWINSLVGLAIVLSATAVVTFIGRRLAG